MKSQQGALLLALAQACLIRGSHAVPVPGKGLDANEPFPGFVSFSIEFSSFPDYAGNNSNPNKYSDNLLDNLGNLMGTKPYIRVGGNTQDIALYNASLPYGIEGTYTNPTADYPNIISIGPSYFESYNTFTATKFSHGFHFVRAATDARGWQTLRDTVPLACKALAGGKLNVWEYGNELDLVRNMPKWNEAAYVADWQEGSRIIRDLVQRNCSELGSTTFMAPSNAGVGNALRAPAMWQAGLASDENITLFSTHNYISGANALGVTLQGTLMNHNNTVNSVNAHVVEYNKITAQDASAPPLTFGECNSLYNQGKPGLSNTFGAALWGVDFSLYSASVGFKRSHMHQGTNYRYASWQPIHTAKTTIGTKAPYYGNIAVAAFLGNQTATPPRIANIPLNDTREAAYAAYVNSGKTLARILVVNLNAYNSTVDGIGEVALPPAELEPRPSKNFTFTVPDGNLRPGSAVGLRRLLANGSDAISGITFDGWSYNYELAHGRPVRLANVTVGETVTVDAQGAVTVAVQDSSAVILDFDLR